MNQVLYINADKFVEVDNELIPTGNLLNVENTPMDFRESKLVGKEIDEPYNQLLLAGGYDHNWIAGCDKELHEIVRAEGDKTGIAMTISSDYPGVQVYSGNFLKGIKGKKGQIYLKKDGICFEPQFYPNAVNIPQFISPVCKEGETYRKQIIYKFEV